MGFGDQLMATGMAKGFAKKGKRVAFGNRQAQQIIWDHNSAEIFRDNPNIAPPGSEKAKDLHWIEFYRGARIYNWHDRANNRWVWNYDFKVSPGEVALTADELGFGERHGSGYTVIEPHVPEWKVGTINKRWAFDRYADLSRLLSERGHKVLQLVTPGGGAQLPGAQPVKAPDFRRALAVLSRAALYVGPEGGLHHGAAAFKIPAVVIFGSWIPPQVTGYSFHINLASGIACGSLSPCNHCRENLDKISLRKVYDAAKEILRKRETHEQAAVGT